MESEVVSLIHQGAGSSATAGEPASTNQAFTTCHASTDTGRGALISGGGLFTAPCLAKFLKVFHVDTVADQVVEVSVNL